MSQFLQKYPKAQENQLLLVYLIVQLARRVLVDLEDLEDYCQVDQFGLVVRLVLNFQLHPQALEDLVNLHCLVVHLDLYSLPDLVILTGLNFHLVQGCQ